MRQRPLKHQKSRPRRYARGTPEQFEVVLKAAKLLISLAGGLGFEPRQAESEEKCLRLQLSSNDLRR